MALTRPSTDSGRVPVSIQVAEDGDVAGPRLYALAVAGALQNAPVMRGGDYIWGCESTNWNSATATLQLLGQDGVTWRNMRNAANTADLTMTANGFIGVGVGQGSTMRVLLSGGTPTAFYANLAGLG